MRLPCFFLFIALLCADGLSAQSRVLKSKKCIRYDYSERVFRLRRVLYFNQYNDSGQICHFKEWDGHLYGWKKIRTEAWYYYNDSGQRTKEIHTSNFYKSTDSTMYQYFAGNDTTYSRYYYSSLGKLETHKTTFYPDGKINYRATYRYGTYLEDEVKYDSLGHVLYAWPEDHQIVCADSGNVIKYATTYDWVYCSVFSADGKVLLKKTSYDEHQVIRETQWFNERGDATRISGYWYRTDSLGTVKCIDSSATAYVYDSTGRCIGYNSMRHSKKIKSTTDYIYREDGKKIKEITRDSSGATIALQTFTYYRSDTLKSQKQYAVDSKIRPNRFWKYDRQGQLRRYKVFNSLSKEHEKLWVDKYRCRYYRKPH